MKRKVTDILDALIPAAFVATILGACFSGADYIALLSIEHFMEDEGWLASGWDSAHNTVNYGIVTFMTLFIAGFIGWWMFGTARNARLEQGRR